MIFFCTFVLAMERFFYLFVWLSRIHHCRGFGIQSPADYRFARYVINEHWPYYAYEQFTKKHDGWLKQRIGRLCFRVANFRQPSLIQAASFIDYLQAGAQKTRILEHADVIELAVADSPSAAEQMLSRCNEQSIVIVNGIHSQQTTWKHLTDDLRTGIAYDLYYCGILFFDTKKPKQYYKINF